MFTISSNSSSCSDMSDFDVDEINLEIVAIDSFTVCAENYVYDFKSIDNPSLKQQAVYNLLKFCDFKLSEYNSKNNLLYCKNLLDNSFVDEEVEQIKIFLYLMDIDLEFTSIYNDGNSTSGDDEGYSSTYYHLGDDFIQYTVSDTRFSCGWSQGYSADTTFNTLAECMAAVKKLKESGDVETNPGPVFSRPVYQTKVKLSKKEHKRMKIENKLWKKLQRDYQRKRTEYELSQNDDRSNGDDLHYQMFVNQLARTAMYASANYLTPCLGTALATGVEGANALHTLDELKVTSGMFHKSAEKVAEALPGLIQNSDDITRLSKKTLENLDYVVQCLRDRVESITLFEDCKVNPLHFCIVMILAYITFSYDSLWTGIPMILLTMYMFGWDELLINKIRNICGIHYQMNLPINVLGQIIFTLIAYCGVGAIPTDKWYDSLLRRMDLIPKSVKGAKSIWDYAGSVFETCEKEFKIFFLGFHKEDLYVEESLYSEVKIWADRIIFYQGMPNRKNLAKDVEAVREIEQMFAQMNRWLHVRAIRSSLPNDVLSIILSLRPQLNDLYKLYVRSTVHEGGPRKAPLCVFFTGDSHHGKSEMLIPIALKLLHARGYTDPEQSMKEIYTRTVETEYWDNYVGQKLVVVDDAFQIKDSLAKPSIEFMESIRLINTAPAQVHCADTMDKGTYFSSEIVLYTSNLHHGLVNYINSLNCPEAALNRLNANAFRVTTFPEFESDVIISGKKTKCLDKEKLGWSQKREEQYEKRKLRDPEAKKNYCEDCKIICTKHGFEALPFCPHHYKFEKYNVFTDQAIGESMCFNDMLEHLIVSDTKTNSREAEKLEFYDKFAAAPTMFEMHKDELDWEDFKDANDTPASAIEEIGYIDMNLESNIEMFHGIQKAKAAFTENCNKGIFKDSSPDGFARYLMQAPELHAFYEKMLVNPTNVDDVFLAKQEKTRENARIKYLFMYFFLSNKPVEKYFKHIPGDFSEIKDKYFFNIDFLGFVKEMTDRYNIMPIYQPDGEENLAFDLEAFNLTELYMDVKIQLARLEKKGLYDKFKFAEVPDTFWKKCYAKICKKLTSLGETIKEFFKSCSYFTILGFFSIILAVSGMVWKFLPSTSDVIEEKPKKPVVENTSYEALFGKCNILEFIDDEVETVEDALPLITAKFCFFYCDHCAYVKTKNVCFDCCSRDSIIQAAKDVQTYYKESMSNAASLHVESALSSAEVQLKMKQTKIESDFTLINENDNDLCEHKNDTDCELSCQGLFDSNCHAVIKTVMNRNMYLLHTDKSVFGNVLFLKGHTMMFNKHFPLLMQHFIKKGSLRMDDVLYLSNLNGMKVGELLVSTFINGYTPIYKTLKDGSKVGADAAILTLDGVQSKIPVVHKNIIKYFLKNDEIGLLTGAYRGILPSFNNVYDKKRIVPMYKYMDGLHGYFDSTKVIDLNDFEQPITYRDHWAYNSSTVGGDCGAPLFIENSNLAHKIVGIHCAGGQGISMGQLITQEMLEDVMDTVSLKYQCCAKLDILGEEIYAEEEMVGSVPVRDGLMVHGHLKDDMKVIGSSKTKIIESDLFDQVSDHTTLPTLLGKTGDIDPMEKGLRKFGKYTPLIDPKLIEVCGNDVSNNLNANPSGKDKSLFARILPYDEAVKGNEDDEFLAPINRKTSMGFPYTILFDHPEGKKAAFGHDEWTLDTEQANLIKQDVEILIDNASKGIQTGVYWTDTLKMERRSIEKVMEGKTRVFCAGPVHFTLAFRMYFLGFAAFLMHNRNFNEISTGTNVFSNDWDVIAKKILSKAIGPNGSSVGAGDFSNYDGSLSSQILWYILDMINDWYDDGKENASIRRGLWLNIVNAIHINHSVIYQCTHSQPSGCPLTAVLNSIYNSIVVRMVYILIARDNCPQMASMAAFEKSVAMVAYGDDNLIGIHHSITSWFNMNNISKYFLIIGHEYTDESKSSQFVNVKDLSECGYLKRKFIFNEVVNRHIAPLDITVILEIPQWTKKGLLRDEIQLANIDVCMRELCLHDKDVFLHYSKLFRNKCVEFNIAYRFRTYEEYQDDVLNIPDVAFESGSIVYQLNITDTKFTSNNFMNKLKQEGKLAKSTIRKCKGRGEGTIHFDYRNKIVHLLTDNFQEKYIFHIKSKILDCYLDISESGLSTDIIRGLRIKNRQLV